MTIKLTITEEDAIPLHVSDEDSIQMNVSEQIVMGDLPTAEGVSF